ncbi:MAG: WhiB family transcriptional regulator [Acidimicrobiales bacterium]
MVARTLHPPCDGGLDTNASFRPTAPEWQRFAACRGSDPALFHGTPTAHRQAQLLCRRCPVSEICLWSAMAAEAPTPYRYGVWGGLTAPRRHRLATELAGEAAEALEPDQLADGGPGPGEYLQHLQDALDAWQAARIAQGATDAA